MKNRPGLLPQLALHLRVEVAKMCSLTGNPLPLIVLGSPLGFVFLKTFGFWLRARSLDAGQRTYWYFISSGQFFWEFLLAPLVTLALCSWLVWIDREPGHWKVLLSQPLTRSSYLLSKAFSALVSLLAVQLVWWIGHAVGGAVLGLSGGEALWRAGSRSLQVWAALTPTMAFQIWLAVRLNNPFTAFGIGLVGNTAAIALGTTAFCVWHPWGLSQLALRNPIDGWQLPLALAGTLLLTLAAIRDFDRKDLRS